MVIYRTDILQFRIVCEWKSRLCSAVFWKPLLVKYIRELSKHFSCVVEVYV